MTAVQPAASLREVNKGRRRAAILDAARTLFREMDSQDVSADRIARKANVATTTVYNLIGKREQLIGALLEERLNEYLAEMQKLDQPDPVLRTEASIRLQVKIRTKDPAVSRAIFREQANQSAGTIIEKTNGTPFRMQTAVMKSAMRNGQLKPDCNPEALAQQILDCHNGAFFSWLVGSVSERAFLRRSLMGFWTVIAAFGGPKELRRAEEKLRALV